MIGEREHLDPLIRRALDHVAHAPLRSRRRSDQQVSLGDRLGLACRRRELVRIRADGHDDLDAGRIADDLADDVTEDVRRHDDGRPIVARRRVLSTRAEHHEAAQYESENLSHNRAPR